MSLNLSYSFIGSELNSGLIFSSAIGPTSVIQRTTRTHRAHGTELPAYCASWERNRPNGIHRRVLYRPRFVRHRIACYAARAADESWLWRMAAGVWNPCRSMSQVVL